MKFSHSNRPRSAVQVLYFAADVFVSLSVSFSVSLSLSLEHFSQQLQDLAYPIHPILYYYSHTKLFEF